MVLPSTDDQRVLGQCKETQKQTYISEFISSDNNYQVIS